MKMNNKQIAKQILADYHAGAYALELDLVAFSIDGLTVRCKDNREAVNQVAEKYRKGLPYNGTTPMERRGRKFAWPVKAASTARVCNITTFLSFWDDGEIENAKSYLDMFPQDKWPAKVSEILGCGSLT